MRKLIVTCQCGQRMQVPQSAFGKAGLCPSCGHTVRITNQNAARLGGQTAFTANRPFQRSRMLDASEDDKRRYGEAVDLFKSGRFGEALAIFDSLAQQYPSHQGIESARGHCMRRLHGPAGLLESDGNVGIGPDGAFDRETVRRVILNKMLRGASEEIQLQATELAARVLGMLGEGEVPSETPSRSETAEEAPESPEAAKKNAEPSGNGRSDAPRHEQADAEETEANPEGEHS